MSFPAGLFHPFFITLNRINIRRSFFTRDQFEALKSRLVNSNLAMAPSELNEDNFGKFIWKEFH